MKTKQILWMALVSLFMAAIFNGCSKDEDNNSDLVGTWVLIKSEVNDSGHYYNDTYDVSEEEEKMTFKGDGTFYFYDEDLSGKYSYSGSWITFTYKDEEEGEVEEAKLKVLSLTSSELVWDSWAWAANDYDDGSYAKSTYRKIQ
ncbi:MAG: lipocalin family protein [Prevotellaceae bacterium]|jgi:hypothetical protein|nr:lipocalin family protein [Prevotellaceae bacterium]